MKKTLLAFLLAIAPPVFAQPPDTSNLTALRQAAEKNDIDAQYELGILYEFGYNFPEHKTLAYTWYQRAAEQGNPLAAKRRDALKPQLNAAEIERAQALLKNSAPTPVR